MGCGPQLLGDLAYQAASTILSSCCFSKSKSNSAPWGILKPFGSRSPTGCSGNQSTNRHPFSRQIHATKEPSSSARIVSPTIAQTGQSSKPPSKPRDTLPRRPIFPGACPGGKQERNGQITS